MKAVLALTVLAVFAAVTDSSTVPSYDNTYSDDVTSILIADNSNVAPSRDGTYIISVEESPETPSSHNEFSVIPTPRNWNQGNIGPFDRLLHTFRVSINAIAGLTQTQTLEYRRVAGFGITAMRGFETRVSNQGVSVNTAGGGIGQQFVVIRLTSRPGGTIHYDMQIWGP